MEPADQIDTLLDSDLLEPHDEVAAPPPRKPPSRMPSGTLAPPFGHGDGSVDVAMDVANDVAIDVAPAATDLDHLRAQAYAQRAAETWDALVRTLRRLIDLGELQDALGEEEAMALYAELGRLEADELDRPTLAIDAWRKVLAIDPSDAAALSALADLLAREERWAEAIDVLEQRALVADDEPARADALMQAAALWEERVDDADRAADVYVRVCRADAGNDVAFARLDAIYRQHGKWTELVDLLLERSEAVAGAAQQVAILHDVAAIYAREQGDAESAFYVLVAALQRDGGAAAHARTTRELERLATDGERWPELLDEYAKRAADLETSDRAAAAELWLAVGRGHRERLANVDAALHAVQQALRLDPNHASALAAGAELQRAQPLQRARTIERQDDTAGAIHAYEQALAQEPTSRTVLEALDRLYRRAQAWQPLADILARRAQLAADDQESVELRLELGGVCAEQLADPAQAIAAYEQVRELEPHNRVALRALEGLYDRSSQHLRYVAVLEAQLAATTNGGQGDADRVALLERIAAAWEERVGNALRAADAYEQLLAIDDRDGAAYRLLARLYQQAGEHEALVATYERHIAATTDFATRGELYAAIGQVCETQLRDPERAIAAYTEAIAFDDAGHAALAALARLHEQAGDWDRALDALQRQLRAADAAARPELHWRIGRIQYAQLGDAAAAEASLLAGLAIDPAHVAAMDELATQYSERGDWQKAAQMMTRAAPLAPVAVDKVRRLLAAANIYRYELDAAAQAKPLYAEVIALDPEHVDAGQPLAELYYAGGEWAPLSPVIEMLCRKAVQRRAERDQLAALYFRAARCAAELGDAKRALGHYQSAYDADPAHLPTLAGRADLSFEQADWETAGKLYQQILVQHRDALREADVVRVYSRLGHVRLAQGDRKKALHMFDKALEQDPRHRETLAAVVELHEERGDWNAVVRAKRGLADIADDAEKRKLLGEIATVYRDRLQNAQQATAGYREALELAPEDRQLLQKTLDLYIDTKQWRLAVEIMERFVALEQDPFRRGVYFHAAATVCRDELKALDEAVDYFDAALDNFFAAPEQLDEQQLPRALMAFEAIDRILTTKRDWKAQERAYRDMIKRLPTGEPRFFKLHVGLIDALAEIYRSRLKQYDAAAGAFAIAQQMDPDNKLRAGADRAEILAELYVVGGPDHAAKAVDQHARMLRRDPFKYDSYRALARVYKDAQQWDKYWCMCNALAFLKKAEPDELAFRDKYKPRGMVKAKTALTADSWGRLAHADENRYISAILRACWQGVAAMKAFPHKDIGLKREERRELHGDQLVFSKLFVYLAQVLDVTLPEVYIVDDNKAAELQLANLVDRHELCPSFVVRPHALQGKTEREVAFLLARRLAFMRPEYYLRMLLPTNTELKVVVLSAIVMLQPQFPVPPNMVAPIQQYLPALQKHMPPHALEQLGVVVQKFIQATPEINLAKWGHAADAAAHRVGLVMSGDLDVAARAVAAEPVVVDGPSAKDKIKDLVLFAISEDYFAVRAQTGLTIG